MIPDFYFREAVETETEAQPVSNPMDFVNEMAAIEPSDLGVPHSEWRPNQLQALEYIRNAIRNEDKRKIFLQLPTGSGKSALPTALGHNGNVLVLVQSLALLDQYKEKYGFSIVKGMAEYECILPAKIETYKEKYNRAPRVSECHFEKASDCPVHANCLYYVARARALSAKRMACTYPFAMLSRLVQTRPGIAVWDEAHVAAETILELSEVRFTEKFRIRFGLAGLPMLGYQDILDRNARSRVVDWMANSIEITGNPPKNLFDEDLLEWRNANTKLQYAMMGMSNTAIDYFFDSRINLDVENTFKYGSWRQTSQPGFLFRPMTAAFVSSKLFKGKFMTTLMSATIGDPEPLADELGIGREYTYKDYPHPVPLRYRPVYDLNLSRMTYDVLTSSPIVYRIQANKISDFVNSFDPSWRGVIMCASYDKTYKLRDILMEIPSMKNRVYYPPKGQEGLNARINAFLVDPRPGLIAVDTMQGWGHGIDLYGDLARFAIVASVPFGNHTDPFEKARRSYKGGGGGSRYAWWMSYMHVPQACGRVSRGETDEQGDYVLNVSALADGSATTKSAMRNYPSWFRDSVLPWEG